jgi:hypothetical protein
MVGISDVTWFKQQFSAPILSAVAGKPYDIDMLTAVACQETGYIWQVLRHQKISIARLLELCVGDTLDASGGRNAFPKTKADLVAKPKGAAMFALAHQALVDMATYIKDYAKVAQKPDKFCHGYGVFQFDLQFFLTEPDYFLKKGYADFDQSAAHCVRELEAGRKAAGLGAKTKLTDYEFACVAIAYNTGHFHPAKGLKQGYFDGHKYYGEYIADYLAMARSVPTPIVAVPVHSPGSAPSAPGAKPLSV